MGKMTLNTVPCPDCRGPIEGIVVEEDSITNAKRVPVLVPAKTDEGVAEMFEAAAKIALTKHSELVSN